MDTPSESLLRLRTSVVWGGQVQAPSQPLHWMWTVTCCDCNEGKISVMFIIKTRPHIFRAMYKVPYKQYLNFNRLNPLMRKTRLGR